MGETAVHSVLDDPTVRRFRAMLEAASGDRLERVMLYGSRARGDARADSDYDVAVFLSGEPDLRQEWRRLADLGTDLLYDDGGVVHAIPFRAGTLGDRTPLMHEIRREGVV